MIAMYTINAAYANRLEHETGSIEVGKLADLVVLDHNLFAVTPGPNPHREGAADLSWRERQCTGLANHGDCLAA